MARLDRMCVEDDEANACNDGNEHERREKLFEWVVGIHSYPQPC